MGRIHDPLEEVITATNDGEKGPDGTVHDLIVVGAGPCGLAVAIAAASRGLSYQILDRGCITSSLTAYPYYMTFFSTAERLEIGDVPFTIPDPKPTRREALAYYRKVVAHHGIAVRQRHTVMKIEGCSGRFNVHTRHATGGDVLNAKAVVLATGGFGEPNYLEVPGGDSEKVVHYYKEPYPFFDQEVLVVGGANSAVEAALEMHRNGVRVQMIHFNHVFDPGVKPWVLPDMENRIASGEVPMHWGSRITDIAADSVTFETGSAPGPGTRSSKVKTTTMPNDWVVAMTGWRPDRTLLAGVGASVDEATGVPAHDPATMETDVAGVYIAGVIAAGNNANKIFIENGREHGALIADAIRNRS